MDHSWERGRQREARAAESSSQYGTDLWLGACLAFGRWMLMIPSPRPTAGDHLLGPGLRSSLRRSVRISQYIAASYQQGR